MSPVFSDALTSLSQSKSTHPEKQLWSKSRAWSPPSPGKDDGERIFRDNQGRALYHQLLQRSLNEPIAMHEKSQGQITVYVN